MAKELRQLPGINLRPPNLTDQPNRNVSNSEFSPENEHQIWGDHEMERITPHWVHPKSTASKWVNDVIEHRCIEGKVVQASCRIYKKISWSTPSHIHIPSGLEIPSHLQVSTWTFSGEFRYCCRVTPLIWFTGTMYNVCTDERWPQHFLPEHFSDFSL